LDVVSREDGVYRKCGYKREDILFFVKIVLGERKLTCIADIIRSWDLVGSTACHNC
jgi:hypothetical protein